MVKLYTRIDAISTPDVELHAVEIGLKVAAEWRVNIAIIFTDCKRLKQVLEQNASDNAWRINKRLAKLKQNYGLNHINIEGIHRDWNVLFDKLPA